MWRTTSTATIVSVVLGSAFSCVQHDRSAEQIDKRSGALRSTVATSIGTNVVVDLDGGIAALGGISVEFAEVTIAGDTAVAGPASVAPPEAFAIEGPAGLNYYQIGTTAIFSGPVSVCIHYEDGPFERQQRMLFDDGSGFVNVTTSLDTLNNIVCGLVIALNAFPGAGDSDTAAIATPAGSDVFVDLNGGTAVLGGISVEFMQVVAAGMTALIDSKPGADPGAFPPGAIAIQVSGGAQSYQIGTTAIYDGPIQVCIHYDKGALEPVSRMLYNDSSSVVIVTTVLDIQANVVCGLVPSILGLNLDGGSDAGPIGGGPEGSDGSSTTDAADGGPPVADAGPPGAPIGQPCATDGQCASTHCIDLVCCNSLCGAGDPNDCQACSVAAGSATDGICSLLPATHVCRANAGACDVSEACDGAKPTCPPDAVAQATHICYTRPNVCDSIEETLTCSGTSTACPTPTPRPALSCASWPAVAPSGTTVDLSGGSEVLGGLTLAFEAGLKAPGDITVAPCDANSPPPIGFKIVPSSSGPSCWNLHTTPDCSTMPADCPYQPPIQVCVHYDADAVTNEDDLELHHDDGTGYQDATTSVCKSNGCVANRLCPSCCDQQCSPKAQICASADSLSPFALVQPVDTTPPVFAHFPGTVLAFATSTAGARVTFATPVATDAVDGPRPVTCSRTSGTTFRVGTTTINCTAADKTGNGSTVAFTVWVQYQAPSDGTFFLKPIRSNGSSIFRIGRPVPVRFRLTGASAGITNLAAKLIVTKISSAIQGTTEDTSDETVDDTDFVFKFRPGPNIYGYRWKTRGETQGTYQLRADLGDGVSHTVNVSLRKAN